mmetsp:Transcript_3665/g.5585  ORF Transcript_3665/g.5585 Transcript_3665/m.5585 type:complete len:85 (+) Transcript_3665:1788-2042(+)
MPLPDQAQFLVSGQEFRFFERVARVWDVRGWTKCWEDMENADADADADAGHEDAAANRLVLVVQEVRALVTICSYLLFGLSNEY